MEPTVEQRSQGALDAPTEAQSQTRQRQRQQMLVALGLLLATLLVVVIKDHDFWFSSAPEAVADSADETTLAASTPSQPLAARQSQVNDAVTAPQEKSKSHKPTRSQHGHTAAVIPSNPAPVTPTITTTDRTALPPLEVEVVAGGQHTTLQPSNHSVNVDLQSGAPGSSSPAQPTAVMTNANERVQLSPGTAQVVEHSVQPNYPMLAKQMKVQGSVVLQALIGQEGSIQDLRVLSGPAILSTAAMEAVRQWRFRPYFEAGQPIETEAKITVNFTISAN